MQISPVLSWLPLARLTLLSLLFACTGDRPLPDVADKTGIRVPEGYEVEVVAGPDLVDYPMFGRLDETGRLFLFESTGNVYAKTQDALDNPRFRINLLEDLNGDGIYDKSTIFADSIGFPQGGVFYKGSLYATSAPDLWKLTDTDGDGVADQKEVLMSGWVLNVNANSLIGPFMAPDGWMYMTSAIEGFDVVTMEGQPVKGETARVWRMQPGGANLQWVAAGGMNNPVGLAFTDASEPIGTMTYFTDPKAGERDALIYWTEGGVYPKPNSNITRDGLAMTGELLPVVSKYSRVAPSGICSYRSTVLGDDFKGNLFSAQFNTHRILRHQLIREGGSFRTEDEIFFQTDNEDFHPTDVLEGGDGSLLVVETGGWFIKGCPLSQVSKPELEGAIYRIRKTDAQAVADPFGNAIDWGAADLESLIRFLEDGRPFVRDRAMEMLVDRGPDAVAALSEVTRQSSSAEARTNAVFALYRIGSAGTLTGVRQALRDSSLPVRVSAARVLGLAKDRNAVEDLLKMLESDEGAAKRQAATALGQIRDNRAIPGLLAAAENNRDRFIEHAIIYALISLNEPTLVEKGLSDPSPYVWKAALIALDQMPGSPLRASQLTPYLSDPDSILQHTALWIAPHHPEWSGDMLTFLKRRFDSSLTDQDRNALRQILPAFANVTAIQDFMASQISEKDVSQSIYMLEVMALCHPDPIPTSWINSWQTQLSSAQAAPVVKAEILKLIRLHEVDQLDPLLRKIADGNEHPADLRLSALEALVARNPAWSDADFEYLYELLAGESDARLKHTVAQVLDQGDLSNEQLLKIAANLLPVADAFILPRLTPLFQGAYNTGVGQSLIRALSNSPGLDNYSESGIRALFEEYPSALKPEIDQLIQKLQVARADRLHYLEQLEQQIAGGDIERGRRIFFGKAICYTCHTVGSEGGHLGPDLTSIQRDRSVHDLLEAIVYPGTSFVREYETYEITNSSGTHRGIILEETPEAILLGTTPETTLRIPVGEITGTRLSDVSMMPQGLDKLLTSQEMADLMAFILGQDQDPDLDEALLR